MKMLHKLFHRIAGRMAIMIIMTMTGTLWMLPAALQAQTWRIGDIITNPDGSRGIIFYLNADGSGGWMCAMQDASAGSAWGTSDDIPALNNVNPSSYYQQGLVDIDGYDNTQKIRTYQGNSSAFAAGTVDFANGWYLPAAGQLVRLYTALPDIEAALQNAGGTTLDSGFYWTSTENTSAKAWRISFDRGYFNLADKTTSCAVRAICDFTSQSILYDTMLTYRWNMGDDMPHIHVAPTATTQYAVTATTGFGCSNSATQTIIVNAAMPQTICDTVCKGEPYTANGFNIAAGETQPAGTTLQRSMILTGTDCQTVIELLLYISPTPDTSFSATACENEGYNWNGISYYATGDYVQTFSTRHGCDSTVTLHLTVNHSSTHDFSTTACDYYDWNGQHYTSSGDCVQHFTNAAGCDSAVTLHLTVNLSSTHDFSTTACDYYDWNGQHYTSSGDYVQHFINAVGCDSAVTLHLTVTHSSTHEFSATVCDYYDWNGQHHTSSGDYVQHFSNVAGGDSTVTLHLTVNHPVSLEPQTVTVCDEYLWHGTSCNASGTYTYRRPGNVALGQCDTTETLNLTVNHSTTVDTTVTACDSYTWYLNDSTYYTSTIDTCVFSNAAGCDSTVTLLLTIMPTFDTLIQTRICEGTAYTENGFDIRAFETINVDEVTATRTLQSIHGCDSIVTLELSVVDTSLNIIPSSGDFCEELYTELTASTSLSNYVWNTGEISRTIAVTAPGLYSVTASDNNNMCSASAHHTVPYCNFVLYLPNTITPNDCNGLNDYFAIPEQQQRQIDEFEIVIFNRWGEQVFHSCDKNFRWYGDCKEKILYNNVYTYHITCNGFPGERFSFVGSIVVL